MIDWCLDANNSNHQFTNYFRSAWQYDLAIVKIKLQTNLAKEYQNRNYID